MKSKVEQATPSPMNSQRWLLTLECGHCKWVTQKKMPAYGKRVECDLCEVPQ